MFTWTALDSRIKYISINSARSNFFSKCNSKDISQETNRREKYNLIKNIPFFCKNHKLITFWFLNSWCNLHAALTVFLCADCLISSDFYSNVEKQKEHIPSKQKSSKCAKVS